MNNEVVNLISAFSDLRVVVIGEAMLDSYLAGPSERLCREAPVPVVSVIDRAYRPGGAANAAANVRSLGAQVDFLSVIGEDAEGEQLRIALVDRGIATHHLISVPQRATLAKQRVMAGAQLVVRFDQGSTQPLDAPLESQLIERLEAVYPECDAVIVSDYGYGVLSPGVIATLERLQRQSPRILMVDSKRLKEYGGLRPTAIKPNYREALQLLGLEDREVSMGPAHGQSGLESGQRADSMAGLGEQILKLTGAQIGVVTLDSEGALIFQAGQNPYRTYARPQPNTNAAGAGDTFTSAFCLALAAGAHTESAAELASAAASIVVSKEATATCYAEELIMFFSTAEKFVTDVFQLAAAIGAYRRQGQRIVFTNGCFDLLHRGHIAYLNRAKALGDVLVVGLNSDASVRRLKGAARPINTLEDRAQVLAALSSVDHIIAFDGDTPQELIRVIKPDVFAKGGDYTRATLPEASLVESLGGEVHILPYLDDRSTTRIIERIRNLEALPLVGKAGNDD